MDRYEVMGEIERLSGGRKMMRPHPIRDASGRLARDPGAQWDWYYEGDPGLRRYISSTYMADIGFSPDEIDLDRWLEMVTIARRGIEADPLSDDYMALDAPEPEYDEIVGPQEIAAMLAVRVPTVHQWRTRGIMPEPFLTVSGVPLWLAEKIRAWAEETGR